MSNYSKLYWITRLDNISGLCLIVLIISVVVFILYHIIMFAECYGSEDRKEYVVSYSKYRNISMWLAVITGLIIVFMPSRNDLIIIYAGGKTMDFVQSDTSISKIPYQTTSIISEYLDKELKELKAKK